MTTERKIAYAVTPDGFHIAYAVIGEGELCHVFLPEFVSAVDDVQWQHPAHVRFERFLQSLSRFVYVDSRGTGGSDTVAPGRVMRLEDWATDIIAVLDTLEVERVVITGEAYAGQAATYFAVTHPDRTLRLTLLNSFARLTLAEDYSIGAYPVDRIDDAAALVERDWGTGRVTARFVPTLATDPSFTDYFAGRERRTMSPRTAAAVTRRRSTSDIRELLPRVSVPTLVYYTGDHVHIPVEHSRYLAEHIPDAILVEALGSSFFLPDETEGLNAWAEFVVGGPAALAAEKKLLTILFTDVVGSTERASNVGDDRWAQILADLNAYVSQIVVRLGGRLVKQTGDGHLAVFDAPTQAVRAAREIADGVHVLGVEVRCGVHAGEVEVRPDGDIGGIAVHTAARVMEAAGPRQVLVSRTVADLAAGAGFGFDDRGEHELKGIQGVWQLFEVAS